MKQEILYTGYTLKEALNNYQSMAWSLIFYAANRNSAYHQTGSAGQYLFVQKIVKKVL